MGESRHPCRTPISLVSYAAVEEDGTSGLVIGFFDDLDKVCADVVLLRGCLQSCTPNPVEGLLEVYEDMVEILPVLEIFLTKTVDVIQLTRFLQQEVADHPQADVQEHSALQASALHHISCS